MILVLQVAMGLAILAATLIVATFPGWCFARLVWWLRGMDPEEYMDGALLGTMLLILLFGALAVSYLIGQLVWRGFK